MYDKKRDKPVYTKESLDEIAKYPCVKVGDQIPQDAAEFLGIRSALSEEDGKTPIASYYPYYDLSGKLTAYQKRNWQLPKEDKGHFTMVGNAKAGNLQFFGQHKFTKGSYRRTILVEGPSDLAVAWHTLNKYIKAKGITSQSYAIVSLPMGCANAKPVASANEKWLRGADEIILALDNDERAPWEPKSVIRGLEATRDIFNVILSDKIKKVQWPEGVKDAREMALPLLRKGGEKAFYDLLMYGASKYLGEKIISPSQIPFERIIAKVPDGIQMPAFPLFNEQTKGLRTHEFNLLLAKSGSGKTTLMTEFLWETANQGEKSGIIYLEEENERTLQRLIARELKVNYNDFKFDPLAFATEDEIRTIYDKVSDEETSPYVMVNHWGAMHIDSLMNIIKQMVFVDGVRYVWLDHITMVSSSSSAEHERKDLELLLGELASFVVNNDVCITAIMHVNRSASQATAPPKKDEPWWDVIRKESAKGSSAAEQLAFNVWGLESLILPDGSRGAVRLKNLKNRPLGVLGIADTVKLNDKTGLFEPWSDDVVKF